MQMHSAVSEVENDIDPNYDSSPINIMKLILLMLKSVITINKPISVWTVRPYSEVFNLPSMNGCLYQFNDRCSVMRFLMMVILAIFLI